MTDHDYTPADALPEGQAAALAFAIAALVFFAPVITATQYDTLTLPWRQTVGRIHPDDPEASLR